jgi:hypothetical protein
LSGLNSALAPKLDAEIEKCDGSEATTQQILGDLITRPKLTEKLLSKPPFRFLHDVVMEVIRATGFGQGLYSDFESDSANVADKNQKMNFLEKIIKVVGIQLNTLVEARPNRIVAGLEPQNTNAFLQLLAVAARHMPDSSKAVRTVLEQFTDSHETNIVTTENPPNAVPNQTSPDNLSSNFRELPQSKAEEIKPHVAPHQFPSTYSEPKESIQAPRSEERKDTMPDEKVRL